MRAFCSKSPMILWAVVLLVASSAAWAVDVPRKHHPWATFTPGAWRQEWEIVQVFDKEGKVVDWGVTEKKTTLEKVDDQGVTLRVEELVWMAGKWHDRPAETVKQGIYGELEGQKTTIKDLEPETILIEGRKIPCVVREVRIEDPSTKGLQVSRICFNDDVAPYVLRRKTTITGPDKKTVLSETNTTIDGLKMLCIVSEQPYSASHLRTTVKHAKGMTSSLTFTSTDVPGGVVHQCTKKVDKENRLVERTVIELIDCDAKPAADQPRRRLLPRRLRKWRLKAEEEGQEEQKGICPIAERNEP